MQVNMQKLVQNFTKKKKKVIEPPLCAVYPTAHWPSRKKKQKTNKSKQKFFLKNRYRSVSKDKK